MHEAGWYTHGWGSEDWHYDIHYYLAWEPGRGRSLCGVSFTSGFRVGNEDEVLKPRYHVCERCRTIAAIRITDA